MYNYINQDMGEFEEFYNSALRFLSFRPRSEKEVRDNLLKKKASDGIIEKIIGKLKEQNFVNDDDFARWYLEQRIRFKPRSLRLIKIELQRKGLGKNLISNLRISPSLDEDSAKKLAEKRFQRYKDLPREKIYQKLGIFLAGKGFNWDTIKKSIDELFNKRV